MLFKLSRNENAKKKVIIVTTHNKIPSNQQYYLLANKLLNEGMDVILIIDSSKVLTDYKGKYYNWEDKRFTASFIFFFTILKRHKGFDVAILNFSATKFSFLFKFFTRVVIVTIRSDFFANSKIKRFFASLKFLFTDYIQTNSYYMKKRILQNYFFVHKLFVLHNSINIQEFNTVNTKELSLDHKIKVLFVGNLEIHKGFDILLNEFVIGNWLQKLELSVAGEGSLTSMINDDIDGLHYLGKISHDEVLKKMKEHHFLILPARNEAFGQVVIEAMSQKCIPMVALGTGSSEIIVHQESGFVFNNIEEAFIWATNLNSLDYKRILENIDVRVQKFDSQLWIQDYYNLIANA